jgi:hypothetical protein
MLEGGAPTRTVLTLEQGVLAIMAISGGLGLAVPAAPGSGPDLVADEMTMEFP